MQASMNITNLQLSIENITLNLLLPGFDILIPYRITTIERVLVYSLAMDVNFRQKTQSAKYFRFE